MATAAQIAANRNNAQKSTGPRSDNGKARARLNALKHGLRATTIHPVLPHEDPRELDGRIRAWTREMQPRNGIERELVSRSARLSWVLERAERFETACLARRVRRTRLPVSARRLQEVHELGRKLVCNAASSHLSTSVSPWVDDPAVFLRGLEESTEGCRWLLDRWGEFGTMIDHKSPWTTADQFRFIRLQGKHGVEAVYDPALATIFLAWEVLGAGLGKQFWETCRQITPASEPGFSGRLVWREIAPRPGDRAEALAVLRAVVDQQIERLAELLAEHEQIALEGAAELADRAAFGSGARFERLHRYQTARGRELLRTIDTLRKMQKVDLGTSDEECQMADDKTQSAPEDAEEGKPIEPEPRGVQGDRPCQQKPAEGDLADRGRENRLSSVPPPSEPYWRFSRIRLSS